MSSSINQAKAEAQRLIKRYNKLQAEAKRASTAEASRSKASEAEKLVSQISSLQSEIARLQSGDKPAVAMRTAQDNKTLVNKNQEIKRIEAEKTELESRINRIETAQKKTRAQIEQLSRAKEELSRLKHEAEKNAAKQQQHYDEKLQQELSKLIEKKEQEQLRLKQEVDRIRQQAEKDAELLKVQRDSARAMMEKQRQLEREQILAKKRGGGSHILWIAVGSIFGMLIALGVVAMLVPTPLDNTLQGLGLKVSSATNDKKVTNQPTRSSTRTTSTSTASAFQQNETTTESEPNSTSTSQPTQVLFTKKFQDRLKSGGVGPAMVQLPEGSFLMGCKPSQPYRDELPQTEVMLQSFAISQYEITFSEYERFVRHNRRYKTPDDKGWGRDKHPVINVSWDEANAYTKWLTEETGHLYRLPSEREWEYAARAGTTTTFWWSHNLGSNNANCAACGSEWDGKETAPVGSFQPNAFGLYDVVGNVMEWTDSCHRNSYRGAPKFGNTWEGGDCSRRMVRSSSYRSYENNMRLSKRNKYSPRTRLDTLGFRVVRVN